MYSLQIMKWFVYLNGTQIYVTQNLNVNHHTAMAHLPFSKIHNKFEMFILWSATHTQQQQHDD